MPVFELMMRRLLTATPMSVMEAATAVVEAVVGSLAAVVALVRGWVADGGNAETRCR